MLLAWPCYSAMLLLLGLVPNPLTDTRKPFGDLVADSFTLGLAIGPMMVAIPAFYARRARQRTGIDDPRELQTVIRASSGGPVPADPRIRAAAHRLAVKEHEERVMNRPYALYWVGVPGLVCAVLTVLVSPWWGLGVLGVAGLMVGIWNAPRRLERRIKVLEEEPAASASETPSSASAPETSSAPPPRSAPSRRPAP